MRKATAMILAAIFVTVGCNNDVVIPVSDETETGTPPATDGSEGIGSTGEISASGQGSGQLDTTATEGGLDTTESSTTSAGTVLHVELSGETPAGSLLLTSMVNVPLAAWEFTPEGENVLLQSLTVTRQGIGASEDWHRLYLYSGESLLDEGILDPGIDSISLNVGMELPDAQPATFTLVGEVALTAAVGNQSSFSLSEAADVLSSADTVEGGFPVNGETFTIASCGTLQRSQAVFDIVHTLFEAEFTAYVPPAMPFFMDVPLGHPHFAEVEFGVQEGWIMGLEGGIFQPSNPISRAGYIQIFIASFDGADGFILPPIPMFSDVDHVSWYSVSFEAAAELGCLPLWVEWGQVEPSSLDVTCFQAGIFSTGCWQQ